MGIDKSNVRFVIHHTISKSMENFYQESGRAGRDGKYAECILLYRLPDIFRITTMMFSENTGLKNAYSMIEFCINGSKCRRDLIAAHFSEVWEKYSCGRMCDHCHYADRPKGPKIDIQSDCKALRRIIRRAEDLKQNLTALKLVDAWYGKGATNLRIEKVPSYDRFYAEQIVAFLIINDYLKEEFSFTPYATYSYLKAGPEMIPETGIMFQCARIYTLPNSKVFTDIPMIESPHTTTNIKGEPSDEEVVFVSENRKRKRIIQESSSDDTSDDKPLMKSTPIAKKRNSCNESFKKENSIEIFDENEDETRGSAGMSLTDVKSEADSIALCDSPVADVIDLD